MNTMWKLFTGDIKRLTSNVVSIIIVIGLVMIPGLFTWFNVAACWDPFSNMKNLKFAVANVDEGYRSDLIPMKVTVGDQVVNALRANSQLDWTITSKADAVEGARSGKYYAAIVIPKSFSKDMMTFFSDDVQHAELTYYRNEKKNALAPNLLNEGTDEVAAEINTTFAKTITSAGLEITLVSSAAKQGGKDLASAKQGVTDVVGALGTTADAMSSALDASASSFGAVSDSIDKLYSDANDGATTAADELDRQATAIGKQTEKYTEIRNTLAGILGNDSSIITAIDRSIARQNRLRQALNTAATDIRQGNQDAQDQHAQVKDLADQAQNSIANIKSDFTATVKPQIDSLSSTVSDASGILSSGAAQLDSTLGDLKRTSDDASDMLSDARTTLDKVSGKLRSAGAELASFNSTLSDALNSGDMSMVKEVLGNDPETLASTLAAPVQLRRKAVFPVANFGSSMAPFYTLLPLWVGALLMVVTLKTTVSRRTRKALGDPRPHRLFLGHYGVFALIALLQSTVSLGGDLLFLRVQAVHPLLFMLSGWLASLVFSFFTYTMVVSFGNVGKAIGVLMLIVQISGANAAYPVQMLPDFIAKVSPFLPLTHAVTMMRAAIAGIYDMDYWRAAGMLLAFVPPLLLLGLLLRKPLVRFNQWYVAKVESTKVLG